MRRVSNKANILKPLNSGSSSLAMVKIVAVMPVYFNTRFLNPHIPQMSLQSSFLIGLEISPEGSGSPTDVSIA